MWGILTFGFGLMVAWFSLFSLSIYYVEKMPGRAILSALQIEQSEIGASLADSATGQTPAPVMTRQTCGFVLDQALGQNGATPKIHAYFPSQSDWAGFSLGKDCGAIDVLLVDWYELDTVTEVISSPGSNPGDVPALLAKLRGGAGRATLLPILALSNPEEMPANPDRLADPVARNRLTDAVAAMVTDNGYAGLCIDLRGLAAADLFAEIGRKLAAMGRKTCLIAPAQDPVWHEALVLAAADLVVFLAFNDTPQGAGPAPLAAQAWFERIVAEAVATIGAGRLVIAMGSFGNDWVVGDAAPERIGYAEAMRRAARHQAQIEFSPDALNTTIRWGDDLGRQHEIWLLDAVSLFNQRSVLARYSLAGMALWPLGLEDPASWIALASGPLAQMEAINLQDYAGYDGQGPFMRVMQSAVAGHRNLTLDAGSGLIRQQTYSQVPQPYSIRRFGAGADDMVVLTFDDGPDSSYTPQVLNILQAKAVPASFFLIGSSILKSPDIVRRMVAEGHEIGSHTFFHPDIETISEFRKMLELNALQRLMVSVTSHSSALFRTPYGRGKGPLTAAEARPFHAVDQGGYIVVGSNVVPPDWQEAKPEVIVASAMAQLAPAGGNVIVLHDGGGDRSATVAALPLLIDQLRAKGYRFVSLATLLGVGREALMPTEHGMRVTLDTYFFNMIGGLGSILRGMFWVAIFLGAGRSLSVLGLALMRRPRQTGIALYTPAVTVVIPAYNEEDVILESIQTVLASDYPDLRLIVIDDGSQDHTHERVAALWGDDPRVTILQEPNQGKWMALDTAFARIDTEIVVALDADTILLPDAIRKLVRAFHDPKVGAVAGKVQVGNQTSLLTRLQALEYTVAQNIDRRATEVFNGIMVVPGAIGAWRVAAVRKAGLYTNETLAEDADLTVSILRAGYRVVYEPGAISVTEAPETLRGFMRQRLRWTLGMMQAAWKHRRAAREGRAVGLISIPDLWVFGVVLALLAPIADLVFFSVVLDAGVDVALGRPVLQSSVSPAILAGYLALPAIDVLAALLAFGFERRAPWLVLLIPVHRLFYRPLLYITVYRATWRAITGRLAEWGKLSRTGTVRAPDA
ncbi:MAG: glycosyltransferase [Paracoccaceae bacterium]|nr:glycosyltransferase [Paracoccaceae bacterium]